MSPWNDTDDDAWLCDEENWMESCDNGEISHYQKQLEQLEAYFISFKTVSKIFSVTRFYIYLLDPQEPEFPDDDEIFEAAEQLEPTIADGNKLSIVKP